MYRAKELDISASSSSAALLVLKANIQVKFKDQLKEYVDAYVRYIFTDSVEKQFGDFMRGFERGCPTEKWKIFHPVELQVVLLGHEAYDWEQLEKVPAEEDIYFLIGNLFGMALYNSKIAAFPFPLALFKKMVNIQPTLEDLKELSPVIGRD
ncbi:hypothetical protein JD844_026400 [Phrynosoma platyrhinos]|uniref:HECT domain-containing protein n=1 Tax=Phrynosoma platyrhinos TaxID=52577 RepID=A0ABQ7SEU0_PHRPL|nr:hypothetical protein JD844_026400 [Phrynosoma platyrhinos]